MFRNTVRKSALLVGAERAPATQVSALAWERPLSLLLNLQRHRNTDLHQYP